MGIINQLDNNIPKWFAIYTKPKSEKKVNQQLKDIGIESYLPLRKEMRQWKDRKKWIETPLFTSYVFVKVKHKEFYEIPYKIKGFMCYVVFSGEIIAIRESEIEYIKRTLSYDNLNTTVTSSDFSKSDDIEIIHGPLCGMKGKLVDFKGETRISVYLNSIKASLLVEIGKTQVRKIIRMKEYLISQ